ncbi:MAG: hypothetical protein SCALA701_32760 [Candidatus Scalindua sp.]|nr:MAG: hypothetical protein SCALA701_32760 [Candidatus Scalindua sp.]
MGKTENQIGFSIEKKWTLRTTHGFPIRHHKTKGIKRFDTNTLEELEAIKLSTKLNLDCDDAIQYYICKAHNFKIVSFDKHFDSTDVERIEPKSIFP